MEPRDLSPVTNRQVKITPNLHETFEIVDVGQGSGSPKICYSCIMNLLLFQKHYLLYLSFTQANQLSG